MKHFILILFAATLLMACGRETSQTPPADTTSKEKATNTAQITQKTNEAKPEKKVQTLAAKGTTADGKTVVFKSEIIENNVTGTLTVDTHQLAVQGILDSGTLRCWLNSTDDSMFRGNLIGTTTKDAVQAEFIISNNAGKKVIKGSVGE